MPQLSPDEALRESARRPVCVALDEAEYLTRETAAELCRASRFPSCDRFQIAFPDWNPDDQGWPARTSPGTLDPESATALSPVTRQLISSAAWVIGIPTAITVLIMLAIWLTENVWMPTEAVIIQQLLR
jgi:hypothetical protein